MVAPVLPVAIAGTRSDEVSVLTNRHYRVGGRERARFTVATHRNRDRLSFARHGPAISVCTGPKISFYFSSLTSFCQVKPAMGAITVDPRRGGRIQR